MYVCMCMLNYVHVNVVHGSWCAVVSSVQFVLLVLVLSTKY